MILVYERFFAVSYHMCRLSLANTGMRFTKNKGELFKTLEPPMPMVLLQKLPPNLSTFGDISDYLIKY